MKYFDISEILKAINGTIYHDGGNYKYSNVSIDTRKIEKDDIFIAIKGDVFNGNEFVESASQKGALICIIDEIKFDINKIGGTTIIKVDDTKKALRDFAKFYREKLNIKVIGVTGSTGKTTTKDLIAASLSKKYKVFKTKGNFNNEIGLPLMIFKLDDSYDVAVLEMGMSNLNEIHRLAEIARPDIAVITNIGLSHIENLGTRENILKAKLEITDFFDKSNVLIVNSENDLLSAYDSDNYDVKKIGLSNIFDFYAENISLFEDRLEYNLVEGGKFFENKIRIDIPGKHNVLNSLLAVACGRLMKLEVDDIIEGFANLEATSMRLDIVRYDEYIIIDDSYNASPDSMKAALDVEADMKADRRIAILGTMRELGLESYKAHKDVGAYAKDKNIDILIVLGNFAEAYKEGFGSGKRFYSFQNNDETAEFMLKEIKTGDVILVKGSRAMKLEQVVSKLKK